MAKFNEADNFGVCKKEGEVKAAVFTAHPDDETVWMGGTILSKSDWTWKIFVATHTGDDARGVEFKNAIDQYKTHSRSKRLDFEFLNIMKDTQDKDAVREPEVMDRLKETSLDGWDVIFTHNIDGEYNHINHRLIAEYFREKRQDGLNIWHFLCPAIKNPREKKVGEYIESIVLDDRARCTKTSIFQQAYVSQDYLWTDSQDFMTFQFHSGVEMFTRY